MTNWLLLGVVAELALIVYCLARIAAALEGK